MAGFVNKVHLYTYIFFFTALSNCRLTADIMLDAFLLLVDKSKSSLFQAQRKRPEKILRENRVGAGKRREGVAFKHHCCQCLIPVTSSWYTLWLVNFDSLRQHLRQSLGFARRVKQTWRACETLLHRTFPHFNISFFPCLLTRETVLWKWAG